MNNDIVPKGNDFEVVPLKQKFSFSVKPLKSRFTFNSLNEIKVVDAEIIKKCEPGKLCNPACEFEMIEKCLNCGKLI